MISVDYLIIGGGIAGTTAAETIRAGDSVASIAILEREQNPLYSKILIPNYLQNKISRNKLFLRSVGDYESKKIALYLEATVIGMDAGRNEAYVVLGSGEQGVSETFSFKKLLIAAGGVPKTIPQEFDFGDDTQVLRMQTLRDADVIQAAIKNAKTKNALIFGEGFIAMEFMEIFHSHGFGVYSLCRWGLFGERNFGVIGARLLEDYYSRRGIRFFKNIKAEELIHKNTWLVEKNNKPIAAPFVGVGIGLGRNIDVFTGVDKNVGIICDEFLQTSHPRVWSAGDIAEYYDTISERHHTVGNWNSAFMQGHVAALNMLGAKVSFKTVSTYSLVNFDLNITFIGSRDFYDDTLEFVGTAVDPYLFRALFKNNKICGAVLINRFKDKTLLTEMIERGATKSDVEKTFQQKA